MNTTIQAEKSKALKQNLETYNQKQKTEKKNFKKKV